MSRHLAAAASTLAAAGALAIPALAIPALAASSSVEVGDTYVVIRGAAMR
jgi:hypothetical protein